MSLISDPDIRLEYLRNVDDPYGPRLISLNPAYNTNPYIVAAGLADIERWPELAAPTSPLPTETETGRPVGGANLKHTHTIMGPSRTGMIGMRVNGKRESTSKSLRRARSARAAADPESIKVVVDAGSTKDSGGPNGASLQQQAVQGDEQVTITTSAPESEPPKATVSANPNPERSEPPAPEVPAKVPFIPKFKGAAEMEARRRARLEARRPPAINTARPPPKAVNLDPEISSSDSEGAAADEESESESESDESDDIPDAGEDIDGDEFDPDFAATRTPGVASDSASEMFYVLSSGNSGGLSASNPSALATSLLTSSQRQPRLSPVTESRTSEEHKAANGERTGPPRTQIETGFEMVSMPPRTQPGANTSPAPKESAPADALFARKKVPPARAAKSALTAMLASASSNSSNPFTELYAAISGRAEKESMSVQIYFPHAREPAGRAMELNVRKDATVEEVVGFALWSYWEEGWLPRLDEGLGGEDDPKREVKLSAIGWILRIAEEDGEVDEDFPPPDRTAKISKFNFDAYAILEANPSQVQQNRVLESKLQRRPSRVMAAKKKVELAPAGLAPPGITGPGTSAMLGSTLASSQGMLSSSLGPSSSYGPQVFLRIRIAEAVDSVHVYTTVQVSSGTYMQEVLELVCRKRKLADPNQYALILPEQNILVPLDRTVASLEGKTILVLAKRSMLQEMGVRVDKQAGRTTDPNASIFKRQSEVPEVGFSAALDYMAAYKKYTVHRKIPMLVGRLERVLAFDGGYIHIMPSAHKAKAVFESGKTASYKIDSVIKCKQSSKSSSFKFVVHQDGRVKRYDFEAESPKAAAEIVKTIREMKMKANLERSGTVNRSRRSRQVM
ncbi:SIN1-domain-containing protein [Gloeophyllum trabeum ATCC 11539]|uniref:SIN1-domain-containing protein n=1 Tax=Gloeophyllum trabeum (strain ATCC 11539 / FP-39264 / Madison 617) TaxID=670483 RepID=S7Q1S3_GLOTA|nr:SIN1-domain-containing protein [Gloeophyllum trabeum ATCC 11539]EPQ53477.1 SIN1-domain-containing protein [Gloeophyllum trabeum ATCC 11539]